MSERLKALTDKIYHEGIEKAQEESDRLLDQARNEAEAIRTKAKKERNELIDKTKSEMDSYRKKVLAEIRMSARKTANQIKNQLHDMLVEKAIKRPVEESLRDPKVMSEVLKATAGALTRDGKHNLTAYVQGGIRNYGFPVFTTDGQEANINFDSRSVGIMKYTLGYEFALAPKLFLSLETLASQTLRATDFWSAKPWSFGATVGLSAPLF